MTYGGHPGDSAALAELAADRGLMLLEDAAHGLGGSLAGRQLGTFGLAGDIPASSPTRTCPWAREGW